LVDIERIIVQSYHSRRADAITQRHCVFYEEFTSVLEKCLRTVDLRDRLSWIPSARQCVYTE